MTSQEKLAVKIIYNEYVISKDPKKLYMKVEDLISKSDNQISDSDIVRLVLHGQSKYIGTRNPGYGYDPVHLLPDGILYMEQKWSRITQIVFYWIFGASSLIAAIYSILSYYK